MTLAVTGYNSRIVQELLPMLPDGPVLRIEGEVPVCSRYLLCAGVLRAKRFIEQTGPEIGESIAVNLIRPISICEEVLEKNERARICIIGSESGYRWSYDDTYAATKAALHRYVETKKLKPEQQLICIAPSIIADAGMTTRRKDVEELAGRKAQHPKRRFLKAAEVARLIYFLLYVDEGYLTGQVIRMNGGDK